MTSINFTKQVDQIEDLLFGFALKLTRNREDAKDLKQETLTRAYANKHRFKVGTNFKAWITTIMRNNFINNYRKRRTRNKVEKPLDENFEFIRKVSVDNTAGSNIMSDELRNMLASIDEGQRKPFMMYFRGYNYKEIASQMDLPLGTVKSRIYFARQKMRKLIEQRYGTRNVRRA